MGWNIRWTESLNEIKIWSFCTERISNQIYCLWLDTLKSGWGYVESGRWGQQTDAPPGGQAKSNTTLLYLEVCLLGANSAGPVCSRKKTHCDIRTTTCMVTGARRTSVFPPWDVRGRHNDIFHWHLQSMYNYPYTSLQFLSLRICVFSLQPSTSSRGISSPPRSVLMAQWAFTSCVWVSCSRARTLFKQL